MNGGKDSPDTPESGGKTENAEKFAGGAAALIIAILGVVLQIRDKHSGWWTALVIFLCLIGFSMLFVRWQRRPSASGRNGKLWSGTGWLFLLSGVLVLTLAPQISTASSPGSEPTTNSSSPAPNTSSNNFALKTLLTVPDETGRCEPAGTLSKKPSLSPGAFAITPGTQVSILLQGSLSAKIVVTHIRTVVDGHSSRFAGIFQDWTNPCQGEEDKEFYIADLNGRGGDISLNPQAEKMTSDELPITVSSQDPVSVYIVTPTSVTHTQALIWHIEVIWVLQGEQHTTEVYDSGYPIVVSAR